MIAMVGASAHVRVISELVVRAMELLFHHSNNPIRFFATEAEGREWLTARRRELVGPRG